MIQNQTAEVARNKKAENEAQGKMNYHNRRADDYLKKAQSASDPAQKKNFENLANAQFEEAVKAEAAPMVQKFFQSLAFQLGSALSLFMRDVPATLPEETKP